MNDEKSKKYRFLPASAPGRVARGLLASRRAGLLEWVIWHGFRPGH